EGDVHCVTDRSDAVAAAGNPPPPPRSSRRCDRGCAQPEQPHAGSVCVHAGFPQKVLQVPLDTQDVPVHAPLLQADVAVQVLASVHELPLVVSLVNGLVPTCEHAPLLQMSYVQALLSVGHELPFVLVPPPYGVELCWHVDTTPLQ